MEAVAATAGTPAGTPAIRARAATTVRVGTISRRRGRPTTKPKGKGRGKAEGASGVCYTWARREFGGKGPKCQGCKYAHKFESNRQKKKVRRELKELDD